MVKWTILNLKNIYIKFLVFERIIIMSDNNVKNAEKILQHVITRINQKVKLNADDKKQISQFIADKMTGPIKIEFLDELPNGEFEYGEFHITDSLMKSYTIQLAYGINTVKDKYPNILYIIITQQEIKSEMNNYQSTYEYIVYGIISRLSEYIEELKLKIDMKTETQIYNFLLPLVDGKVWMIYEEEIPKSDNYQYKNILFNYHILNLAYGSNIEGGKFPNVLYVSVVEAYELKFRDFWEKNYLPICLLEDAIRLLDLSKQINVIVYERVSHWRQSYMSATNPIIFGQKVDKKKLEFRERWPIGFVDGTTLVITSPNERMDYSGMNFIFN